MSRKIYNVNNLFTFKRVSVWMECLGEDVNRVECRGGSEVGVDRVWLSLLSLGLGDCVWCVLLPKVVANATLSSKTTPPVSHN